MLKEESERFSQDYPVVMKKVNHLYPCESDDRLENNDQIIDILKTEDGVYQTRPVKIYVTEIE